MATGRSEVEVRGELGLHFVIVGPAQACIASGGSEDELSRCTQKLAQAIATYKTASKHVRSMGTKPKLAKSKAAPSS